MRRTKQKENPLLRQLFWECTLRCNLNCRHCGSDCHASPESKDMDLSDFLKILENIAPHVKPKNTLVITTGGEPLLRPDIVECGRAISQKGFLWGMVTNGMLLGKEKLNELLSAGLRTIAISLDGFEEEHNWMRGNPKSFSHVLIAIEALKQTKGLEWDVITCVNQKNVHYLPELKSYLIEKGIKDWRIFTVFPSGRAADNKDLQLSDKQILGLMDFIKATRKEGKIHLSYGCENFLGNYEKEVRDYYFSCQAGISVASILNDGSISGCLSIRSDYHQGNIYKDQFMDVWINKFQLYRNREWMKKGDCISCKMWRYCEGNGMHLRDDGGRLLHCHYKTITSPSDIL